MLLMVRTPLGMCFTFWPCLFPVEDIHFSRTHSMKLCKIIMRRWHCLACFTKLYVGKEKCKSIPQWVQIGEGKIYKVIQGIGYGTHRMWFPPHSTGQNLLLAKQAKFNRWKIDSTCWSEKLQYAVAMFSVSIQVMARIWKHIYRLLIVL